MTARRSPRFRLYERNRNWELEFVSENDEEDEFTRGLEYLRDGVVNTVSAIFKASSLQLEALAKGRARPQPDVWSVLGARDRLLTPRYNQLAFARPVEASKVSAGGDVIGQPAMKVTGLATSTLTNDSNLIFVFLPMTSFFTLPTSTYTFSDLTSRVFVPVTEEQEEALRSLGGRGSAESLTHLKELIKDAEEEEHAKLQEREKEKGVQKMMLAEKERALQDYEQAQAERERTLALEAKQSDIRRKSLDEEEDRIRQKEEEQAGVASKQEERERKLTREMEHMQHKEGEVKKKAEDLAHKKLSILQDIQAVKERELKAEEEEHKLQERQDKQKKEAARIREQEETLGELQATLTLQQEHVAELKTSLDQLRESLAERERKAAETERELQDRVEALSQKEEEQTRRHEELAERELDLNDLNNNLKGREQAMEEQQKEIDELKQTVKEWENRHHEEEARKQAERLQREEEKTREEEKRMEEQEEGAAWEACGKNSRFQVRLVDESTSMTNVGQTNTAGDMAKCRARSLSPDRGRARSLLSKQSASPESPSSVLTEDEVFMVSSYKDKQATIVETYDIKYMRETIYDDESESLSTMGLVNDTKGTTESHDSESYVLSAEETGRGSRSSRSSSRSASRSAFSSPRNASGSASEHSQVSVETQTTTLSVPPGARHYSPESIVKAIEADATQTPKKSVSFCGDLQVRDADAEESPKKSVIFCSDLQVRITPRESTSDLSQKSNHSHSKSPPPLAERHTCRSPTVTMSYESQKSPVLNISSHLEILTQKIEEDTVSGETLHDSDASGIISGPALTEHGGKEDERSVELTYTDQTETSSMDAAPSPEPVERPPSPSPKLRLLETVEENDKETEEEVEEEIVEELEAATDDVPDTVESEGGREGIERGESEGGREATETGESEGDREATETGESEGDRKTTETGESESEMKAKETAPAHGTQHTDHLDDFYSLERTVVTSSSAETEASGSALDITIDCVSPELARAFPKLVTAPLCIHDIPLSAGDSLLPEVLSATSFSSELLERTVDQSDGYPQETSASPVESDDLRDEMGSFEFSTDVLPTSSLDSWSVVSMDTTMEKDTTQESRSPSPARDVDGAGTPRLTTPTVQSSKTPSPIQTEVVREEGTQDTHGSPHRMQVSPVTYPGLVTSPPRPTLSPPVSMSSAVSRSSPVSRSGAESPPSASWPVSKQDASPRLSVVSPPSAPWPLSQQDASPRLSVVSPPSAPWPLSQQDASPRLSAVSPEKKTKTPTPTLSTHSKQSSKTSVASSPRKTSPSPQQASVRTSPRSTGSMASLRLAQSPRSPRSLSSHTFDRSPRSTGPVLSPRVNQSPKSPRSNTSQGIDQSPRSPGSTTSQQINQSPRSTTYQRIDQSPRSTTSQQIIRSSRSTTSQRIDQSPRSTTSQQIIQFTTSQRIDHSPKLPLSTSFPRSPRSPGSASSPRAVQSPRSTVSSLLDRSPRSPPSLQEVHSPKSPRSITSPRAVQSPWSITSPRAVRSPRPITPPRAVQSPWSITSQRAVQSSRSITSQRAVQSPRSITPPRAVQSPRSITSPRAVQSPWSITSPRAVRSPRPITPPRAVQSPKSTRSITSPPMDRSPRSPLSMGSVSSPRVKISHLGYVARLNKDKTVEIITRSYTMSRSPSPSPAKSSSPRSMGKRGVLSRGTTPPTSPPGRKNKPSGQASPLSKTSSERRSPASLQRTPFTSPPRLFSRASSKASPRQMKSGLMSSAELSPHRALSPSRALSPFLATVAEILAKGQPPSLGTLESISPQLSAARDSAHSSPASSFRMSYPPGSPPRSPCSAASKKSQRKSRSGSQSLSSSPPRRMPTSAPPTPQRLAPRPVSDQQTPTRDLSSVRMTTPPSRRSSKTSPRISQSASPSPLITRSPYPSPFITKSSYPSSVISTSPSSLQVEWSPQLEPVTVFGQQVQQSVWASSEDRTTIPASPGKQPPSPVLSTASAQSRSNRSPPQTAKCRVPSPETTKISSYSPRTATSPPLSRDVARRQTAVSGSTTPLQDAVQLSPISHSGSSVSCMSPTSALRGKSSSPGRLSAAWVSVSPSQERYLGDMLAVQRRRSTSPRPSAISSPTPTAASRVTPQHRLPSTGGKTLSEVLAVLPKTSTPSPTFTSPIPSPALGRHSRKTISPASQPSSADPQNRRLGARSVSPGPLKVGAALLNKGADSLRSMLARQRKASQDRQKEKRLPTRADPSIELKADTSSGTTVSDSPAYPREHVTTSVYQKRVDREGGPPSSIVTITQKKIRYTKEPFSADQAQKHQPPSPLMISSLPLPAVRTVHQPTAILTSAPASISVRSRPGGGAKRDDRPRKADSEWPVVRPLSDARAPLSRIGLLHSIDTVRRGAEPFLRRTHSVDTRSPRAAMTGDREHSSTSPRASSAHTSSPGSSAVYDPQRPGTEHNVPRTPVTQHTFPRMSARSDSSQEKQPLPQATSYGIEQMRERERLLRNRLRTKIHLKDMDAPRNRLELRSGDSEDSSDLSDFFKEYQMECERKGIVQGIQLSPQALQKQLRPHARAPSPKRGKKTPKKRDSPLTLSPPFKRRAVDGYEASEDTMSETGRSANTCNSSPIRRPRATDQGRFQAYPSRSPRTSPSPRPSPVTSNQLPMALTQQLQNYRHQQGIVGDSIETMQWGRPTTSQQPPPAQLTSQQPPPAQLAQEDSRAKAPRKHGRRVSWNDNQSSSHNHNATTLSQDSLIESQVDFDSRDSLHAVDNLVKRRVSDLENMPYNMSQQEAALLPLQGSKQLAVHRQGVSKDSSHVSCAVSDTSRFSTGFTSTGAGDHNVSFSREQRQTTEYWPTDDDSRTFAREEQVRHKEFMTRTEADTTSVAQKQSLRKRYTVQNQQNRAVITEERQQTKEYIFKKNPHTVRFPEQSIHPEGPDVKGSHVSPPSHSDTGPARPRPLPKPRSHHRSPAPRPDSDCRGECDSSGNNLSLCDELRNAGFSPQHRRSSLRALRSQSEEGDSVDLRDYGGVDQWLEESLHPYPPYPYDRSHVYDLNESANSSAAADCGETHSPDQLACEWDCAFFTPHADQPETGAVGGVFPQQLDGESDNQGFHSPETDSPARSREGWVMTNTPWDYDRSTLHAAGDSRDENGNTLFYSVPSREMSFATDNPTQNAHRPHLSRRRRRFDSTHNTNNSGDDDRKLSPGSPFKEELHLPLEKLAGTSTSAHGNGDGAESSEGKPLGLNPARPWKSQSYRLQARSRAARRRRSFGRRYLSRLLAKQGYCGADSQDSSDNCAHRHSCRAHYAECDTCCQRRDVPPARRHGDKEQCACCCEEGEGDGACSRPTLSDHEEGATSQATDCCEDCGCVSDLTAALSLQDGRLVPRAVTHMWQKGRHSRECHDQDCPGFTPTRQEEEEDCHSYEPGEVAERSAPGSIPSAYSDECQCGQPHSAERGGGDVIPDRKDEGDFNVSKCQPDRYDKRVFHRRRYSDERDQGLKPTRAHGTEDAEDTEAFETVPDVDPHQHCHHHGEETEQFETVPEVDPHHHHNHHRRRHHDHDDRSHPSATLPSPSTPQDIPRHPSSRHSQLTVTESMIEAYGYNPLSESPFTARGYPPLALDSATLDHISVPFVKRKALVFLRTDKEEFVEVGRGTYGCVYLAQATTRRGTAKVVVKDFFTDSTSWELIVHEARMLCYLQDTGVIPHFYGLLKRRSLGDDFSLIQQYFAQGKTLHTALADKEHLSPEVWLDVAWQLACGLLLIHERHVLLNDLKGDNVLIDLRRERKIIKYIDLGMATYRKGLNFHLPEDQMSKFNFLSPEVRAGAYTSPMSDVYSLGYLLEQINRLAHLPVLRDVTKRCTDDVPADRPHLPDVVDILLPDSDHLAASGAAFSD
ncbi:uncharacterized protein [Littorina saxatilis]|uniref:uncharacterized protein isoform X2 n=1 Tax=Littorina saxatilis TaxID=31220 RepID=UPI0038B496EC